MISSETNFLIVGYPEFDFLFNRNQIAASMSDINSRKFDGNNNFFRGTIDYAGKKILSFDLDSILRKMFSIKDEYHLNFSVISSIEIFSEIHRNSFRNYVEKNNIDCDSDYISFLLTSRSEIKKINISEIKRIPFLLRNNCYNNGIIGCRFPTIGKIQYFADIEIVISNYIFNSEL